MQRRFKMADEESKSFMPVDVDEYDAAVDKADYVLVPGEYKVTIEDWEHKQGPKCQYILFKFKTLDCPNPDDNGIPLSLIAPIEGAGFNIFTRFCQAVGQKWEGRQVTPEFCDSVVGLELNVETSIETYMEVDRAKVKRCIAASNMV
jgi:hypothetical protein